MASLKLYEIYLAVIDGVLQVEEQKLDWRESNGKTRLYLRSAVPASGLELNPKKYGATHVYDVAVFTTNYGVAPQPKDVVVRKPMRLKHFALGCDLKHAACARYIFESID